MCKNTKRTKQINKFNRVWIMGMQRHTIGKVELNKLNQNKCKPNLKSKRQCNSIFKTK